MRNWIVIGFLVLAGTAKAQDWESVSADAVKNDLLKVSKDLRGQNYSLRFERKVYAHYTDATPAASESGIFMRGIGNEYTSEQASQLIIQNDRVKMVVDSAQGTILLMRPDSLFLPVDLSLLSSLSDYSLRTMMKEGHKILNLVPLKQAPNLYELQLWFRGDGSLAKVIIYLPKGNYQQQSMDDETEELPMVVMTYEKKSNDVDRKLFTLSTWLSQVQDSYELVPALNGKYTLSDLRYTPPKN